MGSQPAFQIVPANFAEERIVRVLRHAARLRGEVRRQRKQRNRRVVTRPEEKRDRQAVRPLRRRDHAMHVGAQIAVRGHFENLADVDDEGSRDRRRVDPAAIVSLNLQAGLLFLQEKGHEPGILVGAHALIALVRRAAGIADDLDERVRRRRVDRRENVFGLFERGGERAQHSDGKRRGLILIGEKRRLELRERGRPLVRTLQARPMAAPRGRRAAPAFPARCRPARASRACRGCARSRRGCSRGNAASSPFRWRACPARAARRSVGRPSARPE